MKVSILVPIYGVEKYIERCAVSLFEQTYEDIEYIFVNDCTKDNSIAILKEVIERYPKRKPQVRIIEHEHNKGLGGARNTAVAAATGEFLMHVDSDDYIDVTCVEKCVKKQMETGADIVSTFYKDDYGSYTIDKYYSFPTSTEAWSVKIPACKTVLNIWGRMIRRSLYIENSIMVEGGCSMGEDYQVTSRLFYFSQKSVGIEESLYYYFRGNETSYCASFSDVKTDQVLYGIDMLKAFYADKDDIHKRAILEGEAYLLAMSMVGCIRSMNKSYYKVLRARMNNIPLTIIKSVPVSYRMTYLIKNFYLLKVYTEFGHILKICKREHQKK